MTIYAYSTVAQIGSTPNYGKTSSSKILLRKLVRDMHSSEDLDELFVYDEQRKYSFVCSKDGALYAYLNREALLEYIYLIQCFANSLSKDYEEITIKSTRPIKDTSCSRFDELWTIVVPDPDYIENRIPRIRKVEIESVVYLSNGDWRLETSGFRWEIRRSRPEMAAASTSLRRSYDQGERGPNWIFDCIAVCWVDDSFFID